ncbi:MAG: thioredoxin family protein [Planctomycetota bacterium]
MTRFFRRHFAALSVAGLLASSAYAGGEGWTQDFAGAQQTAETEDKDLLLDFTGSDWCGWCIRLNEEVFSHDEFKQYAAENFVLVELDYPRAVEQSEEIKAQNAELKDKYQIRGYPTIFLTDAEGRPYAQTGYQAGGPDAYVAHLEELKKVRMERDEHLSAAAEAEGVDKARHLHAALQVLGDDMALAHYKPTVEQIMELDAENQAGLKGHYQDLYVAQEQSAELQSIMQSARQNPEMTIEKIDIFLGQEGILTAVKQEALAGKSQIQMFILQDKVTAKQTLQAAIDVDPESEMAAMLQGAMERFFPEGE